MLIGAAGLAAGAIGWWLMLDRGVGVATLEGSPVFFMRLADGGALDRFLIRLRRERDRHWVLRHFPRGEAGAAEEEVRRLDWLLAKDVICEQVHREMRRAMAADKPLPYQPSDDRIAAMIEGRGERVLLRLSQEPGLVQKRFGETRSYTLEECGVLVVDRSWVNVTIHRVWYERIVKQSSLSAESSHGWFWGTVVLAVLTAGAIAASLNSDRVEANEAPWVWGSVTLLCAIRYVLSRKAWVIFDSAVAFWWNKPSQGELDAFISQMLGRRDEYLRRRYLPTDKGFVFEKDVENLEYLRTYGVIGGAEYEDLRKKLRGGTVEPARQPIGFLAGLDPADRPRTPNARSSTGGVEDGEGAGQ